MLIIPPTISNQKPPTGKFCCLAVKCQNQRIDFIWHEGEINDCFLLKLLIRLIQLQLTHTNAFAECRKMSSEKPQGYAYVGLKFVEYIWECYSWKFICLRLCLRSPFSLSSPRHSTASKPSHTRSAQEKQKNKFAAKGKAKK